MAGFKTRAKYLMPFAASVTLGAAAAAAQGEVTQTSLPSAEIAAATPTASTPTSDGISEIIVTAQKRSQSINDVGMSINAVSAQALANQHLTTTGDLTRIIPALSVLPAGANIEGAPVYTLRGIGFNASNLSAAPAVAVYSDEVPLAYSYMTAGPLLDIQRVEVLKGPQGTLYGQNSTGGAINYIVNKPTDTFEAGVEGTYGRFNDIDLSGYISGPITDTFKARAAIRSIRSDGWQKSITSDARFGDQRQLAGRLLLDWAPTDRLHLTGNLNGWKDKSGTPSYQVIGLNPANPACFNGTGGGCPALGGAQDAYYNDLVNFPKNTKSIRAADEDPNGDFRNDNYFYQGSVRADYDVANDIKLTSISAYSDVRIRSNRDLDGTPYPLTSFYANGNIRAIDQELRLSGKALDDRLNWIVGGNYSDDTIWEDDSNPSGGTSIGQAYGLHNTITQTHLTRKSWAAFANADYKITRALSFTGGIRYTQVRMNFHGCSRDPGDGSLTAVFGGVPGGCITQLDVTAPGTQGEVFERTKEHNVSWRGGLNYKPSRDVLVYANVSRGYKSGDIPAITALVESQLAPVKQEKVTAYEIGTKLTLLDNRLQFDVAAFHYDYVDKQLQTSIDTFLGHAESTVNIPKSRVNGAEVEVTMRPTHAFTLTAGAGYTDTKIKKFETIGSFTSPVWPPAAGFQANPPVDVSGDPFNLAPRWQVNGDAEYDWTVGGKFGMFAGASVTYASKTTPFLGASSDFDLKAHTLLDLRLGIKDPDDKWRVTVFGKNVTSTHYYVGAIDSFDDAGLYAGMPATYGVTASIHFK